MIKTKYRFQLSCGRCAKTWATIVGYPEEMRVVCSGCLRAGESSTTADYPGKAAK